MKKVYYFAYGSNLLHERLIDRVGKCKKVNNHKLNGWKLCFNAADTIFYPYSFINIVQGTKEDFVEGVLYELNEHQFKILDKYEGLYYRYFFTLPSGDIVCTYICTREEFINETKPALVYVNIILEGAANNGLKSTFNFVSDYKKANFKLKRLKSFL